MLISLYGDIKHRGLQVTNLDLDSHASAHRKRDTCLAALTRECKKVQEMSKSLAFPVRYIEFKDHLHNP